MNLLLIGYGKVGKRYFSILEKKKNVKVIILRKKKFISKKFINRIPNLKKISAAIICSPLDTHDYYSKKLIDNKIPFIIEKPISNNISHINFLKKESQKNKITVLVNYSDLFDPKLIKLISYVKKKINKLEKIKLNYGNNNNQYIYKNTISPLQDWLPHPISVITYLFNNIKNFKILSYKKKIDKNKNIYEKLLVNFYVKKVLIILNFSNFKFNKKRNINFVLKDTEINFDSYKENRNYIKNRNKKKIYKNSIKSFDNVLNFFFKSIKERNYKSNLNIGLLEAKLSKKLQINLKKFNKS